MHTEGGGEERGCVVFARNYLQSPGISEAAKGLDRFDVCVCVCARVCTLTNA